MLCGGVVPNYRCGAVPEWREASPASLFIRRLATPGTDGHKIVGGLGGVNTKCSVEQRASAGRGFHGFLIESFSPLGGEKVPEEPAPYVIRGRMRGAHDGGAHGRSFDTHHVVSIRRVRCPGSVRPSPAFGTLSLRRRERGAAIKSAAPRSKRPAPARTARTGRGSSCPAPPRTPPGSRARRTRAVRRRPGWTGRCPRR